MADFDESGHSSSSNKRVLSRQKSVMTMGDNPFQTGEAVAGTEIKAELIADAVLITEELFEADIMSVLRSEEDNDVRLSILEEKKQPYLFHSDHLMRLVDLTPSLKTRLSMICTIAPRLVDPAAKSQLLKDLFRFNSEKEKIDEVLQERTRTIQSARFTNTGDGRPLLFAGGRGARRSSAPQSAQLALSARAAAGGGRGSSGAGRGSGGAGRGRGMAATSSAHQLQSSDTAMASIKATISHGSRSAADFNALRDAPANTSTHSIDSETGDVVSVDHDTLLSFDQPSVATASRSPQGRRASAPDVSAETMAALSAAAAVTRNGCYAYNNNSSGADDVSTRTDHENFTPIGHSPSEAAADSSGLPPAGRPQLRTNLSGMGFGSLEAEPPSPCNSVGGGGSNKGSRAPTPTHAAALALEQHEYKAATVSIAPGFVFTARAPQRGPSPVPPRRVPSDADLGAAAANPSSANSSGSCTPISTVPAVTNGAVAASAATGSRKKTAAAVAAANGNSYRERVAEENAALGVSNSMVSNLRSRFQKDASVEGIAAVTLESSSVDDVDSSSSKLASKAPPRQVSSLVQNLARSLSTNDQHSHSSKNRAKEAQAAIAAGRIMRSISSDEEGDHRGSSQGSSSKDRAAAESGSLLRIDKTTSESSSGGDVSKKQRELAPEAGSEDFSPMKLPLSPNVLQRDNSSNSKCYSTSTTPNQSQQRKSCVYENPPDTIDKAKINAEETFGTFSVSQNGVSAAAVAAAFSISLSSQSMDSNCSQAEKRLIRRHSEYNMSVDSAQSSSAKSSAAGGSDVASLCAAALQITKLQFLQLEEESALSADDVAAEGGAEKDEAFRYRELVRRNYTKEYVGLVQTELERYLTEDEFETVFKRSKAEFYKLPRWRQMEQKKKAMLF